MSEDINKTKLLIARCLRKRLRTEYLDQVRVADLCRDAGISRTTFYMYFKDVFSISEWYWNYGCRVIMSRIGQEYGWTEGHRRMYAYIQNNKIIGPALTLKRTNWQEFEFAAAESEAIHRENLEKKAGRPLTAEEEKQLYYFSFAAASITHKWKVNGTQESPEEMARILTAITPVFILELLQE